jgi:AraC-like DNA-binding protein
MHPLHFKVPSLKNETIRVECWDLDNFYEPIHFHEEFQITLILEGGGLLFVSDSVIEFKIGEVYLFGENLPHVFRNSGNEFLNNGQKKARAVSVFFNQDILKCLLKDIPEAYSIKRLIDFSLYGVKVSKAKQGVISRKLNALPDKSGFERVLCLLDIMECISKDNELDFISCQRIPINTVQENIPKINMVFDFVRNNFNKKITLEQVAYLVNMSPTAFCRFFKQKSQKTFSRFLIEVRISNACKLLYQDDFNTSECCYHCGYNNLSNFHKHFKSVTGMTPLTFRKNILNIAS